MAMAASGASPAMLLSLVAIAIVAALLAIHPFVTYPVSLVILRRWCRPAAVPPATPGPPPRVALCFCAYNEAGVIADKIANLRELSARMPGLAIHCYVDGATDGTDRMLAEHGDLLRLTVGAERRGKTFGMNTLVAQTDADIVIFTDANVMVPPAGIPRLLEYFDDPTVGCVCGHLVYVNPDETETSRNGALYWRLEEYTKRLESDTGSVVGADGSLFAIRRALHPPVPETIIDDMFVSLSILCAGYRVVSAADVLSFERAATSARDEFRRKIRIACQAFNVHRLLWPRLRQLPPLMLYKYVSHRLVRWFSIYFIALAGLASLGVLGLLAGWATAGLLTASGVAAVALAHRLGVGRVRQACDILLALLGVGIGIVRSMRGDRFTVWSPAGSVRAARTIVEPAASPPQRTAMR
jgi:cellulose synthase/poly-beta-1,6-N-acetylglucosamine synthase-like glycosyltransferase